MSIKIISCKKLSDRPPISKKDLLAGASIIDDDTSSDASYLLCCLYRQLSSLIESKATERKNVRQGEAVDPTYAPPCWINKWAISSQKNGFCYELCDRSVGILFDDRTQFIMDAKAQQALYYDDKNVRRRFHLDNWPDDLQTKQSLFNSFSKRRSEASFPSPHADTAVEFVPRLRLWRVSSTALIMQLIDGTVQINYLNDHSKMIFSPALNSVSLVDSKRNVRTYRLQLLEKHGCSKDLFQRVSFAKQLLEPLIMENDDCINSLSQDGYELRRCASLPARLSDLSGLGTHEMVVLSWLQKYMKK